MVFRPKKPSTIDLRGRERLPASAPAKLRITLGALQNILIEDVSATGFSARVPLPMHEGKMVRVFLPTGRKHYAWVRWTSFEPCGCQFLSPLAPKSIWVLDRVWDSRQWAEAR
jgi:hypothetical protein